MKRQLNRPLDKSAIKLDWIESTLDPAALDSPERIIQYCKEMGFIADDYTDIEAVINANEELELTFEDMGESDAYIVKENDSIYRIAVNKKHHKNRQRFSMAHEYMHYQLHRVRISSMPIGERIMYRSDVKDSLEYQANRGASEILMPTQPFNEVVVNSSGNILSVAKKFGVSQDAVRVRAAQLGFAILDG